MSPLKNHLVINDIISVSTKMVYFLDYNTIIKKEVQVMKNKICLGIGIFCLLGTIVMFIDGNIKAGFGYLIFTVIFAFVSRSHIYEIYKINYSKEVREAKKIQRISKIEKAKTDMILKINDTVYNNISLTKEKVRSALTQNNENNYKFNKSEPIKKDELWLKQQGFTITTHSVSGDNPYKNAVPKEVYQFAYSDKKSKTYPTDYVVFDTETTGLEPEIDKIIELSAIKYINNEPVDSISFLINPKQKLNPFITKLTGIKDKDLIEQPTIDEVLPNFFDFVEDYVLIAHNTPFDIKMIACECYRNNINMCDNRLIDTVPLAKRMIANDDIKDYKLGTLKDYFGINIQSHRALQDCEMCAIVYQQYLDFEKIKSKRKRVIIVDEETGEVLQEN